MKTLEKIGIFLAYTIGFCIMLPIVLALMYMPFDLIFRQHNYLPGIMTFLIVYGGGLSIYYSVFKEK